MSDFIITIDKFYQGFSPVHFLNTNVAHGNAGHANAMTAVDVMDPTFLTQGPGLSSLTAGTQAGALEGLTAFILDQAVAADVTYGIGTTKLHKLSSAAFINTGIWPHAITDATGGSSVAYLRGNLYYLFNKASGGDIGKYDQATTFDDNWGSDVPTGKAALQSAPHPVATKEDIMAFGNGRYLGIYMDASTVIYPTKLDFGTLHEVADVLFNQNYWYVAVNATNLTGTNRSSAKIYLYEAAAIKSTLEDEIDLGPQRIGFMMVINGIIYVAHQDLSSTGGFKISYINGTQLVTLAHFTGTLPTFAQKTLYKNHLLFLSNGEIYALGSAHADLPVALSKIADGGYATCGALAAPFGTPMVASSDGATNFRVAKFASYETAANWTSIVIPLAQGRQLAYIDEMIVHTNSIGSNGRADITLYYNQAASNSGAKTINTASTYRHIVKINDTDVQDVKVYIDFSSGNATNNVAIRKIELIGHYKEK